MYYRPMSKDLQLYTPGMSIRFVGFGFMDALFQYDRGTPSFVVVN